MKKFFKVVMSFKEHTSHIYTGSMCFYMFFQFIYGQKTADLSQLFSLLLVSIAAGTMQVMVFSDLLFKKMPYGWRLVAFAVPFFAVLTAFAITFDWFPTDTLESWVTFIAIFIIIFLFITIGIGLYYRLSGRKYDDKLDWYRKNKEK